MPFPGSVSNKAKQAKRRNVIFQCRFSGLSRHEFLFSVQRQSSRSFFGCDKRIWIEKSSLYSTKALLISAYRFSFTFDEITAFISNSDVLRFCTFFKLVSSGKPTQCRRRALSQSGSSNHALLITKKCPRD